MRSYLEKHLGRFGLMSLGTILGGLALVAFSRPKPW